MTLVVMASLWSASIVRAQGQDDCNSSYTKANFGPERPAKLTAFRKVIDDGSGPQQDITLHWINESRGATCFTVEARFSPGLDSSADGEWAVLGTIRGAKATRHLHRDVPAPGELCYRLYASNSTGRSDYSNRVCLGVDALVSRGPASAFDSESDGSVEGSGYPPWYLVAITTALFALISSGGVVAWRHRTHRASAV